MKYYVYILQSKVDDWRYVGYTSDSKERLNDHSQGKINSTKAHRPFKIASYIAVESKRLL